MSRISVRRFALASVALPLLLAGCNNEPVPKLPDAAASTPTTSMSQTPEPAEPAEPTLPPEAEGKGRKAAEAFVRYYYDTVNYAQATGDTTLLRSIGSPGCTACTAGADAIDAIYRQGGTIIGGEDTVNRAKATGMRTFPGAGAVYYLKVQVSNSDQTVSGSNKLDGEYPAARVHLQFEVTQADNGHSISQWYQP